MKTFVDEDTGAGLGRALLAVDVDSWLVARGKRNRIQPGTWDEHWIPIVSADERLILSRNTQMLDSPVERQILIDSMAAIVYLPAHFTSLELLQLVMKKWAWLASVYDNQPRPFAYRLTTTGFPTQIDLVNYVSRRLRSAGRVPRRRTSSPRGTPRSPWKQDELPLR